MQRLAIALALVGTLLPVTLQAQSPPTPGPEHKKLQMWVGDWTFESKDHATPLGPAGTTSGRISIRSMFGGFFVESNGEWKGPGGVGRWHEIDGYDAATKKFSWFLFDSLGSTVTATYTIDDTKVVYDGTQALGEKRYPIRGSIVFAPDFASFVEKREISFDGQTWTPHWESKSTKTKSSGQ